MAVTSAHALPHGAVHPVSERMRSLSPELSESARLAWESGVQLFRVQFKRGGPSARFLQQAVAHGRLSFHGDRLGAASLQVDVYEMKTGDVYLGSNATGWYRHDPETLLNEDNLEARIELWNETPDGFDLT
jgi:hypothetical protein